MPAAAHEQTTTVEPRTSAAQGSPASDSVAVLEVRPGRSTRSVVVRCPHCGRQHCHGWPYNCDTVGHRLAHCGRGSYFVAVVA